MKWNFNLPPKNVKVLFKHKHPSHGTISTEVGTRLADMMCISLTLYCWINYVICWERLEVIENELDINYIE